MSTSNVKHYTVTFKGSDEIGGYSFPGDLPRWEEIFLKIWKDNGHKVEVK